ncbi:MAG: sigma-70 family RNA polymerase sigma factor [Rhodothermia bacterium]|nr:sigma-70 family RNA polymerase sigma factor [Rhodothermia bacterium]
MTDRHVAPMSGTDFRSLVEDNKKSVYYLALRLTGNHHDAEDLSQETFIKALKAMQDFRQESAVSTWLHKIAVNTYLNSRRKRGFGHLALFGGRDEGPTVVDGRPGPDRRTDASILQQYISAALDQLAPRERSAFVLRFYEDMTVPDIADTMSVAPGTVKSLLFRATRKMRDALRPYHDSVIPT